MPAHPPPTPPAITATAVLLSQLGISPAHLHADTTPVPTFGEVIPHVRATLSPGSLRTYNTHLCYLERHWHDRTLDSITTAELNDIARAIRTGTRPNRATRDGSGAVEHFVSAVRYTYRYATTNGWTLPDHNPAQLMSMPLRPHPHRYALPTDQLTQINHIAATTGNDPELDALLLRLHTETACHRSTALALHPNHLDPHRSLLLLHENTTQRWQPISPTLTTHLLNHAHGRGAPLDAQLLRNYTDHPVTTRHYDQLWTRIGQHLPWVARHRITTRWLRHTTLRWVEANFGTAIATAYAGNHNKSHGTTSNYTKASTHEVAAALSGLTGELHPLARHILETTP